MSTDEHAGTVHPSSAGADEAPPVDDGAPSGVVVRILASLPVLLPVLVALLAVSACSLLLLERYRGGLALAIAAVLAVPVLRLLGLGERRITRKELIVDLLALLLAVGFGLVNAKYATQDVVVARDPGVYSVASQWLVHHQSVDVDMLTRVFGDTRGLQSGGVGIGLRSEPDHVYFQGSHGLPAVLAVAGTLFGPRVMYGTNAVLGGLALLAVYGFGRLVVGRWGALAAATILGASLPQIAFSRDAYTEPISQLLLFGGLTLLLLARRGRWPVWLLAGVVVAGGCLTRIDSFLVLPPVIGAAALALAVAPRSERRLAARDTAALLVGLAIPAVLGYLDLKVFSSGYLHSLKKEFRQIELLLVASLLGSVVLVGIGWFTPAVERLGRLRQVTRNRIGVAAGALVVLVGAALAVRPLLQTATGLDDTGKQLYISNMQKAEQVAVDGTRTYAESTVTWLTWYVGPVLVAVGLLGLAILLARAVRTGDLRLVPFFLVFIVTGLGYLVKPSITPDQIWAMRRFLPIVLPGLALSAMLVVGRLVTWLRGQDPVLSVVAGVVAALAVLSPALSPVSAARLGAIALALLVTAGVLFALRGSRSLLSVGVAAVAVLALALPTVRTTKPLAREVQGQGQLGELQKVCLALPANAGVFLLGNMSRTYPMSLQAFCDVPATWINGSIPPSLKDLQSIREDLSKSGRQLYVLGQSDILRTVVTDVPFVKLNAIHLRSWISTVSHAPKDTRPFNRDLYVGLVGPDGAVTRWVTK